MKILIANRGEIARRIARTATALGHDIVGITTSQDRRSVHAQELRAIEIPSYLDADALLEVAVATHCTAVHPGYGFLSENADFAQAVVDAGLTWIGPHPDAIRQMGSKINARSLAESAGVPVIPGYSASQTPDDLRRAANEIGYPVLIKASAGGGGRGIRIVNNDAAFGRALEEARTEAQRSFGDDTVIIERFVQQPRHIEVQLIGDQHGHVYQLGTRECSVQRRYQKLFEEAPAPRLSDTTRAGLHNAAVQLGRAVNYDSAGTVEFVVDGVTGEFFFLEMNTRLQVEHPVTEAVTGLDLVALMIDSACGEPLADSLAAITPVGHALEARIAAEHVAAGFMPSIGVIDMLHVPEHVRWDAGVAEGSEITPHFDSMIAKLIVSAEDRPAALNAMRHALDELIVSGVHTTSGFHRWLLDRPELATSTVSTTLLDSIEMPNDIDEPVEIAARAWNRAQHLTTTSTWHAIGELSFTPHRHEHHLGLRDRSGEIHEVHPPSPDDINISSEPEPHAIVRARERRIAININGTTFDYDIVSRTERWAANPRDRSGSGGGVTSPFPAVIAEVRVAPGDEVHAGDVLVVIEAMKMLHSLTADGAGVVHAVHANVGDQVAGGALLVTFETDQSATPTPQ